MRPRRVQCRPGREGLIARRLRGGRSPAPGMVHGASWLPDDQLLPGDAPPTAELTAVELPNGMIEVEAAWTVGPGMEPAVVVYQAQGQAAEIVTTAGLTRQHLPLPQRYLTYRVTVTDRTGRQASAMAVVETEWADGGTPDKTLAIAHNYASPTGHRWASYNNNGQWTPHLVSSNVRSIGWHRATKRWIAIDGSTGWKVFISDGALFPGPCPGAGWTQLSVAASINPDTINDRPNTQRRVAQAYDGGVILAGNPPLWIKGDLTAANIAGTVGNGLFSVRGSTRIFCGDMQAIDVDPTLRYSDPPYTSWQTASWVDIPSVPAQPWDGTYNGGPRGIFLTASGAMRMLRFARRTPYSGMEMEVWESATGASWSMRSRPWITAPSYLRDGEAFGDGGNSYEYAGEGFEGFFDRNGTFWMTLSNYYDGRYRTLWSSTTDFDTWSIHDPTRGDAPSNRWENMPFIWPDPLRVGRFFARGWKYAVGGSIDGMIAFDTPGPASALSTLANVEVITSMGGIGYRYGVIPADNRAWEHELP